MGLTHSFCLFNIGFKTHFMRWNPHLDTVKSWALGKTYSCYSAKGTAIKWEIYNWTMQRLKDFSALNGISSSTLPQGSGINMVKSEATPRNHCLSDQQGWNNVNSQRLSLCMWDLHGFQPHKNPAWRNGWRYKVLRNDLQLKPAGKGKTSFLQWSVNKCINHVLGQALCPGVVDQDRIGSICVCICVISVCFGIVCIFLGFLLWFSFFFLDKERKNMVLGGQGSGGESGGAGEGERMCSKYIV